MDLEFLKDKVKPETLEALSKELDAYTSTHEEKIRLVNVSTGEYVKKGKLDSANAENERLKQELEGLKGQIQSNSDDAAQKVKDLQDKLDEIARQDALRAAEASLNERFDAVRGNNAFLNTFTENGVKSAFRDAVSASENVGKSDAEIYSSVIANMGEVYKNPNKPSDIPPMGSVDRLMDAEKFKGMTLEEQMKFANTHGEQYQKMFNKE